MDQIIGYLSPYLNTANLNLATLVALFALLAVFLLSMTFGKSRLLLFLLSLYIARFLESNFVFIYFTKVAESFPGIDTTWLRFGIFIIFIMLAFVLLQRSVLRDKLALTSASVFAVAIVSIVTIGFLISVLLAYLPSQVYSSIDPLLLKYFITKTAQFWWAVAPVVSLAFIRRRYN